VLLDQLELQLADLEEDAAQVKAAAAAETIRRRARGPLLVPVGALPGLPHNECNRPAISGRHSDWVVGRCCRHALR
jgi:hypothetical protein